MNQRTGTRDLVQLVGSALDGDGEAFAEIVRRFQDMAVGYGYSLLHDFQLAEDAAQEAFLECYSCLSQLREPAAFPGWFRRIVFKQCDRITRRGSSDTVSLDKHVTQVSTQPNPSEMLERNEIKTQVWSAIQSLPEHERTPVVLYYIGGYSQQEVGKFLDVPVTTVKKRLFSSRQRLRELLIDHIADTLREHRPSRNDSFSTSVMEMLTAARTGNIEQVRLLLARNDRLLNARDWLGNSALIVAVNSGHNAIAELLINAGVTPDVHEAAAIGQAERVEKFLRDDPSLLDSFSIEGFTPLALAAHFGQESTVHLLIERGAAVDLVSRHPLQVTPLHAALFGRRTATARLLIEAGANLNVRRGGRGLPRSGFTPAHYAANYELLEVLQFLLDRNADLTIRDDEGRTPLDVAVAEQKQEAVALLQSHTTKSTN